MTTATTGAPATPSRLRLWPGVAAVVLQWLAWWVVPWAWPTTSAGYISALGALAGGLLVVIWWLFFSRAPRGERLGAVALMAAALWATSLILHESIATAGQGLLFYVYAVPVLSLAFVGWAVLCRRLAAGPRRAAMVVTVLLACSAWPLLRMGGVSSSGADLSWRWSPTPEQQLLAQAEDELAALTAAPADATAVSAPAESPPAWPGFRGPDRDGVVHGVRIATDWAATPPVELWRRPVGPGWSSFAVAGELVYTQEQRGEEEVVSCYRAATGEPVWFHTDSIRFWEANAGAGPRATPTLDGGRVYSFGATGILNALDAADGSVAWSRDVAEDTGVEVPYWGFSGSPLVIGDVVLAAAAGRLAAYDAATGERRWLGPQDGGGYSSPHRLVLAGVPQVVLLSETGATAFAPADGTVLWQHPWAGNPIVQPAVATGGDLLIAVGQSSGIRRLAVAHAAAASDTAPGADGWSLEERWTSSGLKPNFNDFVVHAGQAYGFDGRILASIDLADGRRNWKGGRYGQGQLVLLPAQDLLLVLSERGELALVAASPDRFTELARVPAIEGTSWNHPVLVGDLLLVRNSQEMAAFRLALATD